MSREAGERAAVEAKAKRHQSRTRSPSGRFTPCFYPELGEGTVSDQRFAEPVSLSSTAPADLPPWPCGLLVRPSGSVSTYSRSVLGASGTLGRRKGPCNPAE